MNIVKNSVRSLVVPMGGMDMLVPNVAIAEVINFQPIDPVHEGPDWLLGKLRWRDQDVPVISIEKICGFDAQVEAKKPQISIMNSVQPESTLKFYAVVTAGIPRLIQMDEETAGASRKSDKEPLTEGVSDCLSIADEDAFIPNLEVIQSMVEGALREVD